MNESSEAVCNNSSQTNMGGAKSVLETAEIESFEASNRGQFSCRCTLDQWLDLIGVISS